MPAGSLFYGDSGIPNGFTDKRLINLSPRIGLVYNPDGAGKTTVRVGGALLYDSVGTFIPYRMVAQNPLRSAGDQHQRSLPVQQSVGERARRESVPVARAGQERSVPAGKRRGIPAPAHSLAKRGPVEREYATSAQRQLGLFDFLPG